MPKFTIPVSWTMIDDMEIEADTLEEAIVIAEESDLTTGEYCDSSFEVNRELVYQLNEETT